MAKKEQRKQNVFPDGTPISEWFLQTKVVHPDSLGKKYDLSDYGIYNPQNEMFATFQTKRYFIQNETSSKKIIFQSIQEAVKKHWKILFLPVLFSLNSVGYVS